MCVYTHTLHYYAGTMERSERVKRKCACDPAAHVYIRTLLRKAHGSINTMIRVNLWWETNKSVKEGLAAVFGVKIESGDTTVFCGENRCVATRTRDRARAYFHSPLPAFIWGVKLEHKEVLPAAYPPAPKPSQFRRKFSVWETRTVVVVVVVIVAS